MQIGTPDKASLVVEGAPVLGFKDILGLVPKFKRKKQEINIYYE
jgi:hypothetical protein